MNLISSPPFFVIFLPHSQSPPTFHLATSVCPMPINSSQLQPPSFLFSLTFPSAGYHHLAISCPIPVPICPLEYPVPLFPLPQFHPDASPLPHYRYLPNTSFTFLMVTPLTISHSCCHHQLLIVPLSTRITRISDWFVSQDDAAPT